MAQPIGNTVQPYNATQTLQSGLFKPFQQAGSLLAGGLNKVTSGIEGAFPNAQGTQTPAPSPFQPLPKIGNFTPSPQLQASANQAKSGGLVNAPNLPVTSTGVVPPTSAPDYSGGTQNPNYTNFQMGGAGTGAGTPASTPSPVRGLFPDVVSSLAGSGAANSAYGDRAQAITDKYANLINPITRQTLGQEVGHLTTGTVGVGAGNAAIAAQAGGQLIQGLTAQEDKELAGNAQGITAQGQTQSALTSAGGLAQPQVAAYGQTSFNPTTNEFAGGGSLPPEVMQQYAQMASSGQYAAIPSFITSNPVLNAQLNVAAKALNPSYTPVGAQGASGVLAGVPALQSANAAADGIKNTIQTYLQQNPTLNPSNLAVGNQLQQWIQGKQLTDPKYQTLFNYLDEYTNTLAPILGVGGDPTNLKTQIAQGFINGAASGQSISQVLDTISTLAAHKIQDIQSGATGGGTSVPAATGTSTGGFAETW